MQEVFEKIIYELKEWTFNADINIGDGTIMNHDLIESKNAIEIVKQAAAEYNNGWIPCSERLPENDKYILLSFSNFSTPVVGRYEEDKDGGAFYVGDDDETCIENDLFVNAWQPLPEPYRQEGE